MNTTAETCMRCGKPLSDQLTVDNHIVQFHGNMIELVLCDKCAEKFQSELESNIYEFVGNIEFKKAAEHILKGLELMDFKIDPENFGDTPNRFARAYSEIFSGCRDTEVQIANVLSTSFPADGRDDMVIARNVVCYSMCPHHLLPVEYHVWVGYIPNESGRVLGISKLGRLVNILAKRPILQEEFTREIVERLYDINVEGAIAVVEGQHMCMRMRGAKSRETSIRTTSVSGIFANDDGAKAEFLNAIK